jgi:hypothetical protein
VIAAVAGVDMIIARYLVVALVALIGAVAIGLTVAAAPRGVGDAAVALIGAVSVITVVADVREPALQRADWRAVADAHDGAGSNLEGERLLVVNLHGFLARPLQRYLDGERVVAADEPVTVAQIDVVVAKPSTTPCNLFVGLACGLIFLGAPPPEPLASRLRLVERIDLDQFVVERWSATEPVTITPAEVVPPADLADSLVLATPQWSAATVGHRRG